MLSFKERLRAEVSSLQERAAGAGPLTAATAETWEGIVLSLEEVEARLGHITAYVECLGAADAGNEAYAREEALLALIGAEAEKAEVDLLHAFKAAGDELFAAFTGREKLRDAAHRLRRLRRRARRTMPREQERLAADLAVDGLHAWGRMYNTLSGKLDFEMKWPDGRVAARAHGPVAGPDELGRPRGRAGRLRGRQPGMGARRGRLRGRPQCDRRKPPHPEPLPRARALPGARPPPVAGRAGNPGGHVRRDPRQPRAAAAHLPGQGLRLRPHRHLVVRARGSPGPGRLRRAGLGRRLADGRPRLPAGLPRPGRLLPAGAGEAVDRKREASGQAPGGLLHRFGADRRAAHLHDLRRGAAGRLDPGPRGGPRLARLAAARPAAHGPRLPDDPGRNRLRVRGADPGPGPGRGPRGCRTSRSC